MKEINIRGFFKLIQSFYVCDIIIQNSKFAISVKYLKKEIE